MRLDKMLKLLLLLYLLALCSTVHGRQYTVKVKTGQKQNSGTNAPVWIKIEGESGITNSIKLDNDGKDDFEFGAEDTFSVSGKDVGRVTAVQIYRGGYSLITSPNWLLKWVQVDPPHPRIGFDKWIEKDQWYRGVVPTSGPRGDSS